jgi:two-component system chemotaxis response regulator CheB
VLEIIPKLPADLPASVFVVIHTHPDGRSRMADVIGSRAAVPVRLAVHGEPIERGKVYVAPPDNHLMLRPGYLAVYRGPKENGHRPAVDPLFRSAAMHYGPRVVGIVLSGYQDCGTAGLLSIKARGGIAIAQSLDEAAVPEMPRNAAEHVAVDRVERSSAIAASIVELANTPAPKTNSTIVPGAVHEIEGDEPGQLYDVVCPICAGSLTESHFRGVRRFHCHVGHQFSPGALVREQAESLERALWAAARALEESARLARRMASSTFGEMRNRFLEKAETQDRQAELVTNLLATAGVLTAADSAAVEGPDAVARDADTEPD